jgi:hypothetical protein
MIIWERLRENPEFLLRAVRDPALVGLGANRTYYELRRGRRFNPAGTDIFADEDWDTLVLLDACRHDAYAELTPFDGPVETRESKGSASRQFVRGNFADKTLHDVVYVDGNRWFLKLYEELNCELHAHHDVDRDIADGFVPSPRAVTDAALELHEQYPDKRLLVHYMQPHYPYIATEIDGFELVREGLRETIRHNSLGYDELRAAYRDNLRYVLQDVQRLVAGLDGKTVISSDHGEMLGDRLSPVPVRWVGHPPGIYVDELVSVPWQVVSEGPRRPITPEPPTRPADEVDMSEINQSLRDLGYMS